MINIIDVEKEDIWLLICGYLESNDLTQLAGTCSTLHKICFLPILWKNLCCRWIRNHLYFDYWTQLWLKNYVISTNCSTVLKEKRIQHSVENNSALTSRKSDEFLEKKTVSNSKNSVVCNLLAWHPVNPPIKACSSQIFENSLALLDKSQRQTQCSCLLTTRQKLYYQLNLYECIHKKKMFRFLNTEAFSSLPRSLSAPNLNNCSDSALLVFMKEYDFFHPRKFSFISSKNLLKHDNYNSNQNFWKTLWVNHLRFPSTFWILSENRFIWKLDVQQFIKHHYSCASHTFQLCSAMNVKQKLYRRFTDNFVCVDFVFKLTNDSANPILSNIEFWARKCCPLYLQYGGFTLSIFSHQSNKLFQQTVWQEQGYQWGWRRLFSSIEEFLEYSLDGFIFVDIKWLYYQEELDNCLAFGICSYTITGSTHAVQPWYHCRSCQKIKDTLMEDAVELLGCCEACAKICHKGHEVEFQRITVGYCDCGGGNLYGCNQQLNTEASIIINSI